MPRDARDHPMPGDILRLRETLERHVVASDSPWLMRSVHYLEIRSGARGIPRRFCSARAWKRWAGRECVRVIQQVT